MLRLPQPHRAVVIGGAGAIGAAICAAYAQAGAQVTVLDLDGDAASAVARSLAAGDLAAGDHAAGALDVTDRDGVVRAAEALPAAPDSVVYAAGIARTFDVLRFDWAAYEQTLAVNLHGALHVAQAFGATIVDGGRPGAFTFLSSTAGKRGEAGAAAYCASKFALQGVVECFAAEVGPLGIRVNAICPGDVETPMLRDVAEAQALRRGTSATAELAGYAEQTALRRLVAPADVAAVAVWLASPLAGAISGESINVDAGALTG